MLFLKKREKPENPPYDATLVLNYSSHKSEYYAKQLVRKIKDVLPDLHINIALKTVKVKQLFSRASKSEKVAKFDTPERVTNLFALVIIITLVKQNDLSIRVYVTIFNSAKVLKFIFTHYLAHTTKKN